ncbi:MAG: phosphonate metabolism transcriptional regulator PhnF [Planctomycetota bacterium]
MAKTAPYQQISEALRSEICAEYNPGQFLPSESVLAERFAVNRHTVRRALDVLSQEGLVLRRQGRGTMVLGRLIDYRIAEKTRFTESIEAEGMSPAGDLMDKGWRVPPPEAAQALGVELGEMVVWIEQRRRADDLPIVVSSHYLPPSFGWLVDEFSGGSLHAAILGRTGQRLRQMETTVLASVPTTQDAAALFAPSKVPILTVAACNVDVRTDEPVEYFIGRFRADAVKFRFMPGEQPD